MKRLGILVIGIVGLMGCADALIEKPENLIPKDKMADILYDIALMQALKSSSEETRKQLDDRMMHHVYKNHQIDSAQFVSSDLYYASIPLEYQNIYKVVETRLKEKQEALSEARKKKNDSVRAQVEKRADSLKKSQEIKKAADSLP